MTMKDLNAIPRFSFKGRQIMARVESVYDGDTITIAMVHDNRLYRFPLRMYGYDSPEMKPPLKDPNRDIVKAAAIVARDKLADRVLGATVRVEFTGDDKYGRLLGNVFMGQECINTWMIREGYGVEYFGGTKQPFIKTSAD